MIALQSAAHSSLPAPVAAYIILATALGAAVASFGAAVLRRAWRPCARPIPPGELEALVDATRERTAEPFDVDEWERRYEQANGGRP